MIEEIKLNTLKSIEEQKREINHREIEICNIRAAKQDFSYQFQQSILKTVNSQNMEVMDMRQKDLMDELVPVNKLQRINCKFLFMFEFI